MYFCIMVGFVMYLCVFGQIRWPIRVWEDLLSVDF